MQMKRNEKFKSLVISLLIVKVGFMLLPDVLAVPRVAVMDGSQTAEKLVK